METGARASIGQGSGPAPMALERAAASFRTAQWAADQQRSSATASVKEKQRKSNAARALSFSEPSRRSARPRSQFNFYGGTTAQK